MSGRRNLDLDVLAINRLVMTGHIRPAASAYRMAGVEQIRMGANALLVRYAFVPHVPLSWEHCRDARVQQMLNVCAANFNAANRGFAIQTSVPRKRFTLKYLA